MKAEIFNNKWWINETREKHLDATLGSMAQQAGFNVLDAIEYEFEPYGYTKLWLLAESHLAVHTFPEEARAYVELSSCNKEKGERFARLMEQQFSIDQHGGNT